MGSKVVHVRVSHLDVGAAAIRRAREQLQNAPKRVSRHRATVGLHDDAGGMAKWDYHGAPMRSTLAQVMVAHEFGTDVLPERAWLRGWFDANVGSLASGMREAMRSEFKGDRDAVRNWVRMVADVWRAWLNEGGDFVGLSPATIARKTAAGLAAPDTPLVAVKQFVQGFAGRLDGDPV